MDWVVIISVGIFILLMYVIVIRLQLSWSAKGMLPRVKSLEVSLLHPRRLAKGFSSIITVQIYLAYKRDKVIAIIKQLQQLESSELVENRYPSVLIPGQTVIIELSSPAISFSAQILKKLRGESVNRVTFTAQPNNECTPGRQAAVLSIRDSKTNEEYESMPFFFIIDDFAFDHVSKPILSYVSSGVTGIGSLALFTLSFLEKLDATLGIPVGSVGMALALLFGVCPTFLYKRQRNVSLENLLYTLASRPINPINVETRAMATQDNRNINQDFKGASVGIGNADKVEAQQVGGTIINEAQQQNLAEAAKEIQQLLNQLSQTYPTNTAREKMVVATEAIERIESDPTWKQRVINAAREGGLAAFEKALDNPAGAFITSAIKGWLEA